MITKQQKSEIIDNLKNEVKKIKHRDVCQLSRLECKTGQRIKEIVEAGRSKIFHVSRKTLVKKALEASSFGGEMPKMEGETAVVAHGGRPAFFRQRAE